MMFGVPPFHIAAKNRQFGMTNFFVNGNNLTTEGLRKSCRMGFNFCALEWALH